MPLRSSKRRPASAGTTVLGRLDSTCSRPSSAGGASKISSSSSGSFRSKKDALQEALSWYDLEATESVNAERPPRPRSAPSQRCGQERTELYPRLVRALEKSRRVELERISWIDELLQLGKVPASELDAFQRNRLSADQSLSEIEKELAQVQLASASMNLSQVSSMPTSQVYHERHSIMGSDVGVDRDEWLLQRLHLMIAVKKARAPVRWNVPPKVRGRLTSDADDEDPSTRPRSVSKATSISATEFPLRFCRDFQGLSPRNGAGDGGPRTSAIFRAANERYHRPNAKGASCRMTTRVTPLPHPTKVRELHPG